MNDKFLKVVVGLALENAIYNGRAVDALFELYTDPKFEGILTLHDQLISSSNYLDREIAFWLAFALDLPSINIDLQDTIIELAEMEVLLYDLLWRVSSESRDEFNNWLNYLSNVAQSIRDNHKFDTKILMNLALKSCKTNSVELSKRDLSLKYKVEVLQKETIRLFEMIKRFPVKLVIPDKNFDLIIELQNLLVELLKKYRSCSEKDVQNCIRFPIEKLKASQRFLLGSNGDASMVTYEIKLVSEHLELHKNRINDQNFIEWIKNIREKTRALMKML